jgi:hypothetical protein
MTAKVISSTAASPEGTARSEATKEELQQRVDTARESISQTVEEIRDTVEGQYESVKATVTGILDWREAFQREPLVWSLGALSAGFALGYTIGVGTKRGRRGSSPALAAFSEGLVDELRAASESLPLATIDPQMRALFGFDLSHLLAEISTQERPSRRAKTSPTKRRPRQRDMRKRRG